MAKNQQSVFDAIIRLNEKVSDHPDIIRRLSNVRAFYVYEQEDGKPLFGFSKFVGYEGRTCENYPNTRGMNGGKTEEFLKNKKWFRRVSPNSSEYETLFGHLTEWLRRYGKRPFGGDQRKVRIMVAQ